MSKTTDFRVFAAAMGSYLDEKQKSILKCKEHNGDIAIHKRGNNLQVYRLFHRGDGEPTDHLRAAVKSLETWERAVDWDCIRKKCERVEREVATRMHRHSELNPVLTKGIEWEGSAILVHAYKFEADPNVKIELVAPVLDSAPENVPVQMMASLIRCHEHLVPLSVAKPLAPYDRHEMELMTMEQYLELATV